jgi:hypothetical protein
MTDPVKKVKNATQDAETKIQTSKDHAEGKPSSETLNKAKVKVREDENLFVLTICQRHKVQLTEKAINHT